MSYENRGQWGDNKYRGNTSGHVIKDLITHFYPQQPPRLFLEVFSGGGTGMDVARELGIKSIHLDLNTGWNALVDEIPYGADFVFSHPPYWDIISYQKYNGNHPDDLSLNMSYEEFLKKLDKVNAKIYQSLLNGGRHAFLVGDIRKKGKYYSIIKDMTWFGDLESHIVKIQHNYMTKNKNYSNHNFIPIEHEHLLVFKKNQVWAVELKRTTTKSFDLRMFKQITWRDLIQGALEWIGGKGTLNDIYAVIEGAEKTKSNSHWKEKVRQTLQLHNNFRSVERGVWALAI